MADELHLWERQPHDTPKSWEAFTIYRDMGADRSTAAVAERTEKSETMIQRWSGTHGWVERAAAFDAWVDGQAVDKNVTAILEMRDRHARAARALQTKAIERLSTLDPRELSPKDALSYLVEAIKIEVNSRGLPTQVVGVTDPSGVPGSEDGPAAVDQQAVLRLEASLIARAAIASASDGTSDDDDE